MGRSTIGLTVLFVASRAMIFLCLAGRGSDLGIYKVYFAQMAAGQVPFRDFFPEYPPLVFLYTGIPVAVDPSLELYFPIFRVLSFGVDCLIFGTVMSSAHRSPFGSHPATPSRQRFPIDAERGPWRSPGFFQPLLYILGTAALGPLIYDRIDIVLGAILLVAARALLRGRERVFKLSIGLGIAFKLIPVVLIPMVLARESARWSNDERSVVAKVASTLGTCTLLAAPAVLTFGTMMLLGGYRIDKLFEFHIRRPIQLESVPASIAMILMMFGMRGRVTSSFGSANLETACDGWLTAGGAALVGAACIASAVLVHQRSKHWRDDIKRPEEVNRLNEGWFLILMAAVLTVALSLSKVLSPQYFLFLLPVLVVVPIPRDRTAAVTSWFLIAAIYILTGVIYPWWYFDDLATLRPVAEFMLIVRNELLVILGISLASRAWSVAASAQ